MEDKNKCQNQQKHISAQPEKVEEQLWRKHSSVAASVLHTDLQLPSLGYIIP